MNAPLPFDQFDQTASFAGVAHSGGGACAGPMTPCPLRDSAGTGKHLDFVERRRTDAGMSDNLVRSRAVLGFVGLVRGLVVSAVLIIGVSVGLALTGVSWMVAGQYCAAIVLLVFGLVGVLLYWGTRTERPCTAGIRRYMESAVERRRPYLYLSSINALENARRLGMWGGAFKDPAWLKDATALSFYDAPLGVTAASIKPASCTVPVPISQ